jgi:hypothetical protein
MTVSAARLTSSAMARILLVTALLSPVASTATNDQPQPPELRAAALLVIESSPAPFAFHPGGSLE